MSDKREPKRDRCPMCNQPRELVPFYLGTGRMMVCASCRGILMKKLKGRA